MASFLDVVKGLVSNKNTTKPITNTSNNEFNSGALYGAQTGKAYLAPLQPQSAFNSGAAYGSSTGNKYLAPLRPNSPPSAPGGGYSNTYGSAGGYGASPGTGVGGVAAPDPSAALRTHIADTIHKIQSVYDMLTGQVDAITNEKATDANSNYDQQSTDLNKAYERGTGQTQSAFGARGLGDSSYLGDELGQQTDVYNSNNNSISQNRRDTLGQIGQYAATNKAQFGAAKNSYDEYLNNLGNYDASSLQSLDPQLQSAYGNVQAQQAGLGTNQSFIDGLGKIAPVINQGQGQLADRLQKLVTSGAPKFAKKQLAQGLIKQAQLTDPSAQSYWSNYFNNLLGA